MTERAAALRLLLGAAMWDDGGAPMLDYPDVVDAFGALGIARDELDQVVDSDRHMKQWRHSTLRWHPSWRVVDGEST